MTGFYKIWARRDSNPRPKDYESSALPLRHRPLLKYGVFLFSYFALPVSCVSGATYCFENVTFSQLFLQCHRPLLKYGVFLFSCFALPVSCASGATYCFENVTFSHLFLQCHRPLLKYGVFLFSCFVLPVSCVSYATYLSKNLTFSQLFLGRVPQTRDDLIYSIYQVNIKKSTIFFRFTPLS